MPITKQEAIWTVMSESLPRGQWVHLDDVYQTIEAGVELTPEDHDADAPGSTSPRWQRNVRNVLQQRKERGDLLWDGHAHYMLPPSSDRADEEGQVAEELGFRLSLWRRLCSLVHGGDITPGDLQDLKVHVGEQGIYRDKARTAGLTAEGTGVTVGVLHTGRRYADDLTEDGLIYHYPDTRRSGSTDAAEIEATKAAGRLALPIFVILPPSSDGGGRKVRLGWLADWDDEQRSFRIKFGEDRPSHCALDGHEEYPPVATEEERARYAAGTRRARDPEFRYTVLRRYGVSCAVCGLAVGSLLDAAHIRPVEHDGDDRSDNGLPLCPTHHRAFDAGLFTIDPETLTIHCAASVAGPDALSITFESIRHLRQLPRRTSLEWHWRMWQAGVRLE